MKKILDTPEWLDIKKNKPEIGQVCMIYTKEVEIYYHYIYSNEIIGLKGYGFQDVDCFYNNLYENVYKEKEVICWYPVPPYPSTF